MWVHVNDTENPFSRRRIDAFGGRGMRTMVQFLLFGGVAILATQMCFSQTDFWQATAGPYGGIVKSLAVDSSDRVFAGSTRGVYLSTNGGDLWRPTGLSDEDI